MPDIPLAPVESSLIAAIGYDTATRVLRVRFKDGAIWDYFDVAADTYVALARSVSIGKTFLGIVKYRHGSRRVDEPEPPPGAAMPVRP